MEQKTQEEIIINQQKEIEKLKIKLNERNNAFNKQLLNRTDNKFYELRKKIGEILEQYLDKDLLQTLENREFYIKKEYYYAANARWIAEFKIDDEKRIKDQIADIEMKKFQESLDNFAWAVNNQQG